MSVWQHVKLSEQIRPWDTLACRWDVKQPTNKASKHNVDAGDMYRWDVKQPTNKQANIMLMPVTCTGGTLSNQQTNKQT